MAAIAATAAVTAVAAVAAVTAAPVAAAAVGSGWVKMVLWIGYGCQKEGDFIFNTTENYHIDKKRTVHFGWISVSWLTAVFRMVVLCQIGKYLLIE